MKCGARIALGVAGGYLLGRTKKMKLALMVGGLAAGRKAGGPGQLLAQGTKLLGQSADVARLTDEVRGRLLEAGKAAAVAVATRQVEALTERVVTRVGTLTDAGGRTASDVGETVGDVGRTVRDVSRPVRGRQRPDEVEDYEDEDDERGDEVADEVGDETEAGDEVADEVGDETETEDEDEDEVADEAGDEVGDEAEDENADVAPEEADTEDEVDEGAPAADIEEEEAVPPPPPRRSARTGAGGRRTGKAALTSAGDAVPATRRATGRRSGRPARGRQESSDG
jgi:hypothetical protein